MADGFDDFEMEDFNTDELENYSDSQLNDYFNEISLEKKSLYKRHGDNESTPEFVRVKYGEYNTKLKVIEEERDRRGETTVNSTKELGDPIEAPSSSILTTLKRNITLDKKGNIKRILGMDHQFRVSDGKNSKGLLKDSTVIFNKKGDKAIGLSYKGTRVYVSDDGGESYRKTTNKKNKDNLEEFENVVEKATEEYNKLEEEKKSYPLANTELKTDDIHGLTPKDNSELRGSLTPSESIDSETRYKFLKIQADHFQETIDKTKNGEISLEGFELSERVAGLEKARDLVLEQIEIEKIRETQEEDISRLRRFRDWAKKNIAGLASIAISIAGIIITVIVGARTFMRKGAQATSKFAKAVYKTFKDIAKTLGPILGPVLSAIGSLLATLLKYGAEGIAWLARNLWALVIAILFFIYSRYQGRK